MSVSDQPSLVSCDTMTPSLLLRRFWDLAYPERSYIVAGSAGSPSVSYYRKVIEGTEVVQVSAFLAFLSTLVGTKTADINIINGFAQEWQYFFEFKKILFSLDFSVFLKSSLLR